ncbi:MAG: histidine kinase [Bacteroidota bacterium]|nr:histidine kinase [Bacteroidota bacterium]
MNKIGVDRLINQRNLTIHIAIFLFSLGVIFIDIVNNSYFKYWKNYLGGFILIFVQLELFILLANVFFRDLAPGKTSAAITRIVLSRFALFLTACFAVALIVMLVYLHVEQLVAGGTLTHVASDFFHVKFAAWFKPTITGLLLGGVIFIIILWQDALKREQKLREENLIFQNETLINQVNPHFLFNSLNTLSSLINSKPELAEQFINKLSSIYRYILENIARDKIPLPSELAFISDYFELHKISNDEKLFLTIEVPDAAMFKVPPVSLQTLVENAIKHNKATRKEPLNISIFVEQNQIVVKNNLQRMSTQIKSTGIGLKNLANRVKLISGRDLMIEETTAYYQVKVPLLV